MTKILKYFLVTFNLNYYIAFLKSSAKIKDGVQLLAFFDYGLSRIHKTVPREQKSRHIAGVGPDIRYVVGPNIAARLDWGFKLKKDPLYGGGNSLIHCALNVNF